jgi:hypothetical protein
MSPFRQSTPNSDAISAFYFRIFSYIHPIPRFQSFPTNEVMLVGKLGPSTCAPIGFYFCPYGKAMLDDVKFFSHMRKELEFVLQNQKITFPRLLRGHPP